MGSIYVLLIFLLLRQSHDQGDLETKGLDSRMADRRLRACILNDEQGEASKTEMVLVFKFL